MNTNDLVFVVNIACIDLTKIAVHRDERILKISGDFIFSVNLDDYSICKL